MSDDAQVIAVMNADKIVIQFSVFNNEDQLDRTMKLHKGTDKSVRVMSMMAARKSMKEDTPV